MSPMAHHNNLLLWKMTVRQQMNVLCSMQQREEIKSNVHLNKSELFK